MFLVFVMDPLVKGKIGIWLDEEIHPKMGGGFSYYQNLINEIDNYEFDVEIVFLTPKRFTNNFHKKVLYFPLKFHRVIRLLQRLSYLGGLVSFVSKIILKFIYSVNHSCLFKNDVRLIYYPVQYQCKFPEFPFVITNWDIAHMSVGKFPEFIKGRSYQGRKEWYDQLVYQALGIVVESRTGKEELIRFTKLSKDIIEIVPMFTKSFKAPDNSFELLSSLKLKANKYFYYPAQFWPHKNHAILLNAFSKYSKLFSDVKLVFTGADKGNQNKIKKITNELNLNTKVVFLGFVEIDLLSHLYANAIALVMPTFLGPTNLPLIEARSLGCPVICSDLQGHKEMMNQGALYFNPLLEEEICSAMKNVSSERQRENLSEISNSIHKKSKFQASYAMKELNKAFVKFIKMVNC